MREEEPHTSVVVPSLTLDQSELRKLSGASFYEERLLFLLIRLRNPRARMVYVTSQPVHPIILEYYLQFLAGIPASHARSRLTLLCADDASPRSLTEKILERPRLIERIRAGIQDPARAYLTVFNSTPLERKLAVLLGIPLNGVDPNLIHLGTKSGSRKVFREAGVDLPLGLRGPAHASTRSRRPGRAAGGAAGLEARRRQAQRQLLRRGQRPLPLPRERGVRGPARRAREPRVLRADRDPRQSTSTSSRAWAGSSRSSSRRPRKPRPRPSCASAPRARSWRSRPTTRSSAGPSGQVFLGCSFPAHDDYRMQYPGRRPAHRSRAGELRCREPLRDGLPRDASGPRRGLEDPRPRDQPAHGRDDSPVPRAPVPDRRAARSRDRALPLPQRPRQVLPGHRQPALRQLPRPAARGPDRHPHRSTSSTTATAPSRACCSTSSARCRSSESWG